MKSKPCLKTRIFFCSHSFSIFAMSAGKHERRRKNFPIFRNPQRHSTPPDSGASLWLLSLYSPGLFADSWRLSVAALPSATPCAQHPPLLRCSTAPRTTEAHTSRRRQPSETHNSQHALLQDHAARSAEQNSHWAPQCTLHSG